MGAEVVQVENERVVIALGQFRLSLVQNRELMQEIGNSQLLSVRRTFRDQGSPAGSWVPLAPSTIRGNPKIYGAGHKMLIRSGRLLNSIHAQAEPGRVTLGTNLVYAAVHQYGSRDRRTPIGPRTKTEASATIGVAEHSYFRLAGDLGAGRLAHAGRRRIQGPRNARSIVVRSHRRHQNIPARPYLVFRPEDPARIRGIVNRYILEARKQAGLEGGA